MDIAWDASTDGAQPPVSGETTTRERILRDISTMGPITTSQLVDRLGLTETAVRRHIENLLAAGLIESHRAVAGGPRRGRPARSWVVSREGHARLRSDYNDLAGDALRFLASAAGSGAVRAFARHRARDLHDRCAPAMADLENATVAQRTQALVGVLNGQGYAATARPVGVPGAPTQVAGMQLCQGHCPVHHVAAEFPEFCDAETEVISKLLGVHVQRLATLANGAHACTTFVPGAGTNPVASPDVRPSERSSR